MTRKLYTYSTSIYMCPHFEDRHKFLVLVFVFFCLYSRYAKHHACCDPLTHVNAARENHADEPRG